MVRILLTDDDEDLRDLIARGLIKDGHDVVVASDGASALNQIRTTGDFDLLVSDVQMPVMDGLGLMREAVAIIPNLQVIMVSGFAEQLQRAKEAEGVSNLRTLMKPFTLDDIRAEIKAAMSN